MGSQQWGLLLMGERFPYLTSVALLEQWEQGQNQCARHE